MQMVEITSGAIFVADVHYGKSRQDFLQLLNLIEKQELTPKQLFLLGDIFDLLIPPLKFTMRQNQEVIDKINSLSSSIEIYYFEGNHDFLLQKAFLNVKTFPIYQQPAFFKAKDKTVAISHGDNFGLTSYKIFSNLLRRKATVYFLHLATFDVLNNWFLKYVYKKQEKKKLCREIEGFTNIIEAKLQKHYQTTPNIADIVVEGHFHQGRELNFGLCRYFNISAFACDKSFFQVEFEQDEMRFIKLTLGAING